LPSSTLRSLLLAVTISHLPSLLTSPTATEWGPKAVAKFCADWSVPLALLKRTLTVLLEFAVTTSLRPSPLKSAVASARGLESTA
jgi:hypothetical protein